MLNKLSKDIICLIFIKLEIDDFISLSKVNRRLNKISKEKRIKKFNKSYNIGNKYDNVRDFNDECDINKININKKIEKIYIKDNTNFLNKLYEMVIFKEPKMEYDIVKFTCHNKEKIRLKTRQLKNFNIKYYESINAICMYTEDKYCDYNFMEFYKFFDNDKIYEVLRDDLKKLKENISYCKNCFSGTLNDSSVYEYMVFFIAQTNITYGKILVNGMKMNIKDGNVVQFVNKMAKNYNAKIYFSMDSMIFTKYKNLNGQNIDICKLNNKIDFISFET